MTKPALALVTSIGLCLGSALAIAQPQDQSPAPNEQQGHRRGGGQWDPQQRVNMLAKRLKLTDDQKTKLLPIFTDEQQQMQSLRSDSSLSREDRMSKMKSIHDDTDSKINGILNDDQKQQYAQMQQKMRDRMQQRMQNRGNNEGAGAPPPQN